VNDPNVEYEQMTVCDIQGMSSVFESIIFGRISWKSFMTMPEKKVTGEVPQVSHHRRNF
jgi:hypothetical protein